MNEVSTPKLIFSSHKRRHGQSFSNIHARFWEQLDMRNSYTAFQTRFWPILKNATLPLLYNLARIVQEIKIYEHNQYCLMVPVISGFLMGCIRNATGLFPVH